MKANKRASHFGHGLPFGWKRAVALDMEALQADLVQRVAERTSAAVCDYVAGRRSRPATVELRTDERGREWLVMPDIEIEIYRPRRALTPDESEQQ